MKHDSTSPSGILSRKIKALFARVSIITWILSGMVGDSLATDNFQHFISPQQLQNLPAGKRIIIDTRSSWKFLMGHIPGAINLSDWREFTVNSQGIPGQINKDKNFIVHKLRPLGIDVNKWIIIYGDLNDKWRTDGRFFWMFEYFGFKRIALLREGYERWKQKGLPTERGFMGDLTPSQLKIEDIQLNPRVLADRDWIADRLGNENLVIIDNREKHEYQGATPYGSPRGGHIPGAIHIDWREFFETGGNLKPDSELQSILKSKEILPGKEIVVYCTGGVRSAMAYFAFRHLGFAVRNYDGSWWDWSRHPDLPVES